MKIGLTYDLRDDYLKKGLSFEETAEMDSAVTIEELDKTITKLGNETDRIGNIESLIKRIANNERWDVVFNIAEGVYGMGREAQIPALLDACRIPYTFSDTIVLAVALQKAFTKRIVSDLGIPTSVFYSVKTLKQIDSIDIPYPLFVKPVAEGTGKGINNNSIINNSEELEKSCRKLLRKYKQPVLIEKYLPGREFTVGILGTGKHAKAIGIMEIELTMHSPTDVYGFEAKEKCEQFVKYKPLSKGKLYHQMETIALKVHRGMNCRDASRIDFKQDENGDIQFLEINPLAGLHPTHSDLPIICSFFNITYPELISGIIESASDRIDKSLESI